MFLFCGEERQTRLCLCNDDCGLGYITFLCLLLLNSYIVAKRCIFTSLKGMKSCNFLWLLAQNTGIIIPSLQLAAVSRLSSHPQSQEERKPISLKHKHLHKFTHTQVETEWEYIHDLPSVSEDAIFFLEFIFQMKSWQLSHFSSLVSFFSRSDHMQRRKWEPHYGRNVEGQL